MAVFHRRESRGDQFMSISSPLRQLFHLVAACIVLGQAAPAQAQVVTANPVLFVTQNPVRTAT